MTKDLATGMVSSARWRRVCHCRMLGLWLLNCLVFPAQAAIGLIEVTAPTFGSVKPGATGRFFTLNTSGTVTGANAADYITGAAAGDITVSDSSSPSTLKIRADFVFPSGGISVQKIYCSYNGAAQAQCKDVDITVTSTSSASLKIGVEIKTDQVHNHGASASANFNVNVTVM